MLVGLFTHQTRVGFATLIVAKLATIAIIWPLINTDMRRIGVAVSLRRVKRTQILTTRPRIAVIQIITIAILFLFVTKFFIYHGIPILSSFGSYSQSNSTINRLNNARSIQQSIAECNLLLKNELRTQNNSDKTDLDKETHEIYKKFIGFHACSL